MTSRRLRLSVLDTYGVRWDRATFVRDVLQNFFDATPDFRDVRIAVDRAAGTVEVSGPTSFDLELLAYIGATTKLDGSTAGAFGEGFKICALVGVRDFGLAMEAGSGGHDLRVLLDPVPLGRELCYDVTEREEPFPGAFVRLSGCDADVIEAFEQGRTSFRFVGNPKLLAPIAEGLDGAVAVYPAPRRGRGEIYYRRQLRGHVSFYVSGNDPSVTLVHDPPIDELEGDRDRRDLPARPVAEAIGAVLDPEALMAVFLHMMPAWDHGHEVLYGFMFAAIRRKLRFDWPPGWLARATDDWGTAGLAERMGFKLALNLFADLGMKTSAEHFTSDLVTRPPTALETARLQVLEGFYEELHGAPPRLAGFEVFDDASRAAVRGQRLGDRVVVGAHLVAGGFDAAAPTVLHELAHEAGGETAEAFLSRLTRLLGGVIRHPDAVARARERYASATEADARPPPPPPPPQVERYDPLAQVHGSMLETSGVWCTVFAPSAYPPLAALGEALRDAAARAEVPIMLAHRPVESEADARRFGVPGVPTLHVSGEDVASPGAEAEPGYRVRTYGGRLCPDADAIFAALARSKELGLVGKASRDRYFAAQGIAPPPGPEQPAPEAKVEQIRRELEHDLCDFGFGLSRLWDESKRAAVHVVAKELGDDPRPAEELIAEGRERIMEAIRRSRELRVADPDFDDADDLERATMTAAQAAFVAAWFLAPGPERGEAAERAFREVRRLTALLMDLPVAVYLKVQVVARFMEAAGVSARPRYQVTPSWPRFDAGALAPAYDSAAAWAIEEQDKTEQEGEHYRRRPVDRMRIERRDEAREWERTLEMSARHAARSQAIRKAYDDTLAATGDPVTAAAACLRAAERKDTTEGAP